MIPAVSADVNTDEATSVPPSIPTDKEATPVAPVEQMSTGAGFQDTSNQLQDADLIIGTEEPRNKQDASAEVPSKTAKEIETAEILEEAGGFKVTDIKSDGIIYGDLNGDGEINSTDITMARRYYKGNLELTPEQVECLDLNLDGEINSTDITILRRYYKGAISEIPIGR